jgi:glycogen synthase
LIDRKGFDVVLKVIEDSIKFGCRWCIVGLGLKKYEAELNRILQENPGALTYIPALNQKELNVINNQSKWFFFPSRNEPFGLVASEALFAGTPVISTPSGGLKEQVFENVNGFLIDDIDDYNSIIQLVKKAHTMSDDEYNNIRKNCNAEKSDFSLRSVCNRLSEIYNTL